LKFFSIQLFYRDWIPDTLHIGELDLVFLVASFESLGLQQLVYARRDIGHHLNPIVSMTNPQKLFGMPTDGASGVPPLAPLPTTMGGV
jgi:hypothetical protein